MVSSVDDRHVSVRSGPEILFAMSPQNKDLLDSFLARTVVEAGFLEYVLVGVENVLDLILHRNFRLPAPITARDYEACIL